MGLEAATYIASLNASNPVGSTDAKSQGDDHLRLIKGAVKNSLPGMDKPTFLHQARVDVASATIATDLPLATSDFIRITGTTTIFGFGTMAAGHQKNIVFGGGLPLVHNATSLILPSGAFIQTEANDSCIAISLGAGNWVVTMYQKATGKAIIPPTLTEVSSIAQTLLSGFIGVIFEWPGALGGIPTGFLPLDGRAISRTTYSALFGLWGVYYGAGDSSTTFNIPDDRGVVIGGLDNMGTPAGSAGIVTNGNANGLNGFVGAEFHTLTAAQMPVHNHTYTRYNGLINVQSGSGAGGGIWQDTSTQNTSSAGSGSQHNNMQPTRFRFKIVWTGVV